LFFLKIFNIIKLKCKSIESSQSIYNPIYKFLLPQNPGGQRSTHDFKSKKFGLSQLVHSKAEPEQSLQGKEQGVHTLF
jgi:hypothetical protein